MTLEEIKAKYPYLYETHMHTSESSKCAKNTAAEMVRAYKEYGYTGTMVTDHDWAGNNCIDPNLPWVEWIDRFFDGYRHAKAEGDRIGFQVFLGYEASHGCGQHFLIYGLSIEDVQNHPELKTATVEEQYDIVHSMGGVIIQAHPYREADYIDSVKTYEKYVDGIEIINASHSNPGDGRRDHCIWDEKAIKLALDNNLPGTAGSDQHNVNLMGGGVAFPTKLKDLKDYTDRILSGADYVLTNGRQWFDKKGNLLLTCSE
ncbi:MAG: PHP domain-containing protein [Lachnospiraceae bacterium]|nr:PHP domain-containing protein [Lachnospiraceae bacterium]